MVLLSSHRCLQNRAYPGIALVISNHAYSYHEDLGPDMKIRCMPQDSLYRYVCVHAYTRTDVRIAYSVVTKYTYRNCASNAA